MAKRTKKAKAKRRTKRAKTSTWIVRSDPAPSTDRVRTPEEEAYEIARDRAIVEADQWGHTSIPQRPRNAYPVYGVDFE